MLEMEFNLNKFQLFFLVYVDHTEHIILNQMKRTTADADCTKLENQFS